MGRALRPRPRHLVRVRGRLPRHPWRGLNCQDRRPPPQGARETSHSWDSHSWGTGRTPVPAQPERQAGAPSGGGRQPPGSPGRRQGPAVRAATAAPADASEAWLQPSPLHVLLLFSGPCESESALPALLRRAGCAVTAVDTKLGGAAHDVLRPGPLAWDRRSSSASARRSLMPSSLPPPAAHTRATRTPVGLENPADRGVDTSPAYWVEHAEHGSLWRMPCVARALGAYRASFATFAQCSFAAPAQKWTTIALAGGLDAPLAGLGTARYGCHTQIAQRYPPSWLRMASFGQPRRAAIY
mmetsp:Transcript_58714/g.154320  ORF Transcript_58714/g.154320 Transcript_58714/m.154320 type:complete len:298 (-) Transcript_58714:53-946(-)